MSRVATAGSSGLSRTRGCYTLLGVGALLTTVDFLMAFLFAPVVVGAGCRRDCDRQRRGSRATSCCSARRSSTSTCRWRSRASSIFFFTAFYGVRFLMTKDKAYDTKARIATEVTLLFVILTLITGDLWTRFEWGTWWVWEPRLTTYFIMTLLVIAYFVLRNSIEDEERRATYAAVFGIIAFLDAPISFAITRLIPSSVHPVVLRSGGGLTGLQLAAFLIGLFGMLMIAWVIFQFRDARGVRRRSARDAQGRPRRLDV